MQNVSFTAFRKDASALLNRVEEGETIYITRHGKPIAEIQPYQRKTNKTPSWKKGRVKKSIKGASLSSMVLDERESTT